MRRQHNVRQAEQFGGNVRLISEEVEPCTAIAPLRNASIKAGSSTIDPRATLIRKPCEPSASNTVGPIKRDVEALAAAQVIRTLANCAKDSIRSKDW